MLAPIRPSPTIPILMGDSSVISGRASFEASSRPWPLTTKHRPLRGVASSGPASVAPPGQRQSRSSCWQGVEPPAGHDARQRRRGDRVVVQRGRSRREGQGDRRGTGGRGVPWGCPRQVTAGLFDLDGVLTDTAAVHDKAWKETFDAFLRERAERTGEPFVPFDPVADYATYVDGKPRPDGVRDFLASRGITLPEGSPDDGPDLETVNGLGNRKNQALLRRIHQDGRRGVRGLPAVPGGGPGRRAAPGGGVLQRQHRGGPARSPGLAALVEGWIDGLAIAAQGLKGKPAPDSFLAGARCAGVEPAQAAVFEDALAGCRGRPGRRVRVRGRGGPGRAARTRCGRTAPTSWSPTWPSCSTAGREASPGDPGDGVAGRALVCAGAGARPRPAGPVGVAVRAVQRPHRAAREPGRGRAVRDPGHLPQLVLRGAARCRTPSAPTATRRPARRSSTSPTAS